MKKKEPQVMTDTVQIPKYEFKDRITTNYSDFKDELVKRLKGEQAMRIALKMLEQGLFEETLIDNGEYITSTLKIKITQ
jgi:hypothetical protein